jgi:hypothetical protein
MVRCPRPPRWVWVYDPAGAFRRSKKPVPIDIRYEVQHRAQQLIDSTLKPRYLQPCPMKAEFNHLVDLSCQWRGLFFYFYSKYCSPGPRVLSPFFESRFARLRYAGDDRFHLADFRHTGRWCEIAQRLSLQECLAEIAAGGLFTPVSPHRLDHTP